MTPPGIEPATFKLVEQYLNQLRYLVPHDDWVQKEIPVFDSRDGQDNFPSIGSKSPRFNWATFVCTVLLNEAGGQYTKS